MYFLSFYLNLEEKINSNKIRLGVLSDDANSQVQKKKKNKKKTEDAELSQYLQGPKRQNQGSKRRQNTPESQFNELLVNIIDACIKFDNTALFHSPVSRRDYPDYFEKIKVPMDLGSMKSKAKRCEYLTIQQFQDDMKLLETNSTIFNGENNMITKQATSIIERATLLVQADIDALTQF